MIVLGIDPGLATTGWGVIEKTGLEVRLIDYGCLLTQAQTPQALRLLVIQQQLTKLIRKFKPQLMAVEELFFYKNVKSALKVSQARGVVLVTASQLQVPVKEYTPLQVKQAITTYGRADKQQMQKMVKVLLKLEKLPQPDDAADALAVALTCLQSHRTYK